MPYSGKDAFAQRDGQERGRCQEVRCRDCKGPDRVHWNGGSLNNEAVLGGSKPPRPRSARRRNSNPQLSINSNAGGADRADAEIYGVSDKVLAMALSALLLGASDVEQLFTSLRNQAVKSAS